MTVVNRQQSFDAILAQLVAEPAISMAVLTDADGFLVAAVPDDDLAQSVAAIGPSFQHLADRTSQGRPVDQVLVRFDDQRRMVCRSMTCDQGDLVLSIIVEPGFAFRLLTNRAIRNICNIVPAG